KEEEDEEEEEENEEDENEEDEEDENEEDEEEEEENEEEEEEEGEVIHISTSAGALHAVPSGSDQGVEKTTAAASQDKEEEDEDKEEDVTDDEKKENVEDGEGNVVDVENGFDHYVSTVGWSDKNDDEPLYQHHHTAFQYPSGLNHPQISHRLI
ncbi:hypothetical protein ACTXT7_015500, partial [Hymenolepis weldensis]